MRNWNVFAISFAALLICACHGARPGSPAAYADLNTASDLRQIVTAGTIQQLRQPDFEDLQVSLSNVYGQNAFAPLWFSGGKLTEKGQEVVEALRTSGAKGLEPEDYDVRLLDHWIRHLQGSPVADQHQIATLDVAMTIELMRYASALHQGRIDPHQVHFAIRPKGHLNTEEFVRGFRVTEMPLSDVLALVEPPFEGYRSTLAALVRYQKLAAEEPKIPTPPRLPLRRGQNYDDLPALAARLKMLGDLTGQPPGSTEDHIYGEALLDAVKHFQIRHGLEPDGIIDLRTWNAICTPLSERVEQLSLALERWRWMPASVIPAIVVNIPEFELRAYNQNGQLALRMHVIVGKAYRRKTPVFEDRLESVIIRPWWNVPISIQRYEMVPKIRGGLDYLRKNNLQIVDRDYHPVQWDTEKPPTDQLASGELRLRQEPGPENSLGLLKFDFPNDYSVYMHGTPAHQLFARARRDFSHGCIRVEDPDSLAEWLLRDNPEWNRAAITAACIGEQTVRIPLHHPVAVLVLYGTAVVEDDGEVRFFNDLYGYDAELRKALGARDYSVTKKELAASEEPRQDCGPFAFGNRCFRVVLPH